MQFTYQSFQDAGGTIDLTLAPGESRDLVLNADRTQMMAADQLYEGVLQVTDSLGHTQIDLPVSGVGSSRHGMWVGTAVIDSVNRVETISGEEYDAPVGTVDGIVSKGSNLKSVTNTTADGVTTQKTSYDVDFDADGFADLPLINDEVDQITLTSVDDDDETPDFSEGTDYEIVASPLAQITKEGGGYTEAPVVRFEGGTLESPATGTAVLSASVHRVKMTDAGSGYKHQVVDVIFSGGDGVDAKGHIVLDEGVVTEVVMDDGGSGYSSAPTIEFPQPLGGGGGGGGGGTVAVGTAILTGDAVSGVSITSGGEWVFTSDSSAF